jgi:protein-S-isoprenylcysteine O-methyltransferase Ste14
MVVGIMRMLVIRNVVITALSTSGIRLDKINFFRVLAVVLMAGVYLFHKLVAEHFSLRPVIAYFLILFAIRYLFLFGGFGKRGFSRSMIRVFGEGRGWDIYELITSLLFFQRGLCFGLLAQATGGQLFGVPNHFTTIAGIVFLLIGLWVNVAGSLVIGIDTYFYKDLFLERAIGEFQVKGPYKYFQNPMYGIGQLSGYGAALIVGSYVGIIATFLNQLTMYVFNYLIEKPHIHSMFKSGRGL